jgi:hypothetical protein
MTYLDLRQTPDIKRKGKLMPATGPDFISLQASDLVASQAFYEQHLGLVRSPAGPPHAVVFETKPIAFAGRSGPEPLGHQDPLTGLLPMSVQPGLRRPRPRPLQPDDRLVVTRVASCGAAVLISRLRDPPSLAAR